MLKENPSLEKTLIYSILLLSAAYILHFGFLSFLNSPWDFDHLASYYEIAWRFWTTQHFPAGFNPFIQGGRTLGGDPQVFLFSPWTIIASLSPLMAVKLQILSEVSLGAWGTWKLFQYLNLDKIAKLWGLFLFLSCGSIVSRVATGHVTLGYIFFYPTLLWFSLKFEESGFWKSRSFIPAILLFLYLGNHKPNFFIYGVPPLIIEALIRSFLKKNLRPILSLTALCILSALCNSASLLPSQAYFKDFPRHDGDEWIPIPLYTYFANLLMPLRTLPGYFYGTRFLQRHEYNLFLGPIVLLLAYFGFKNFKKQNQVLFFSLTITSFLFVWVGLGSTEFDSLNPYSIFYKLWPGFKSVRVPPRFWIFSSFFILIGSTFAHIKINKKYEKLFMFFGILPLLLSGLVNISKPTLESFGPILFFRSIKDFNPRLINNDVRYQYGIIREGNAVLNSIENLSFPRIKNPKEGPILNDPRFHWKDWSHIEYDITTEKPATISLNINFHPYWKLKGQGHILLGNDNEGLTISLESGNSKGTLEFEQPMAYEGLVVTILSLGVVLLYIAWIFFKSDKSKSDKKQILGLTGGIGSGKSTVASLFREEGIPVIDMDQIGREIIEKDKSVQKEIIKLCGDEVRSNGGIDRKKVREVVFNNPTKRKELESILHPLIWKEFEKLSKTEFDKGARTVLCEAALLIENKRMDRIQGLIVVMADESVRKQRLMDRDKISNELAEQILKTQASDEERRKSATYIIENQAGFYDLKEKVKSLVKSL